MRLLVGVLVGVAAWSAVGCGDLSRGELERGVATLGSISAEGEILAREVGRDRTKKTFARVRARELAEDADHEAEKLHDATPSADIAGARDRAVELAEALAATLRTLQVSPDDESRARGTERTLRAEGDAISALQGEL